MKLTILDVVIFAVVWYFGGLLLAVILFLVILPFALKERKKNRP